jgi:hypothetical protein
MVLVGVFGIIIVQQVSMALMAFSFMRVKSTPPDMPVSQVDARSF